MLLRCVLKKDMVKMSIYLHETKDGQLIKLSDLETFHLKNIIKHIERRAKEGITVQYGGSGSSAEDMWYDEDVFYGKEAKEHLHYEIYKKELKRREKKQRKNMKAQSDKILLVCEQCGLDDVEV